MLHSKGISSYCFGHCITSTLVSVLLLQRYIYMYCAYSNLKFLNFVVLVCKLLLQAHTQLIGT